MHTQEQHITPQAWAKEAWRDSRLDILIPITVGLAGGHFLMALLGLRSSRGLLPLICIIIAGVAALQTYSFLTRLSRDRQEGLPTRLTVRDTHALFGPLFLSVLLCIILAPNSIVGAIYTLGALPYTAALLYLARRYADTAAPSPRVLIFDGAALIEHLYTGAVRTLKRTPGLYIALVRGMEKSRHMR